jgi:hypothetical protein
VLELQPRGSPRQALVQAAQEEGWMVALASEEERILLSVKVTPGADLR